MFFTVRHVFFLLFLVLVQSGLGFGQSEEDEEEANNNKLVSFLAVSSLRFRPGSDYPVFFTVNPHQKNQALQLKCVLMSKSNRSRIFQSDPISLFPGESGQISIPIPADETIWRLFAWSFKEDSDEKEYLNVAPHTLIYSSELPNPDDPSQKKAGLASVFIQTDKPAYKPDDLVRIRVITMGTDDLPHLTSGVNMTITDSKGNVMKKWEQPLELPESASVPSNVSSNGSVALFGEFQKKKNGLSAYEFQLSSEPILGNWTIQVEAGNIKEKMYFDVKRYILPKFQVKVEVPSVLYGRGDVTAAATIKVSYTFGKDLHGNGTVSVHSSAYGLTKTHQIVVTKGEARVHLTLRSTSSSTVQTITANITEKNTGRWQIGKKTIQIYPHETYYVQWINKPPSYKPGLPLTVQLKITGGDDLPVQDVRAKALRITFSSSLNLPPKEISIPLSGVANFTFPTPLQPLPANSKFEVVYINKQTKYDFTLPAAVIGTTSGILIEVVLPPGSTNFVQGQSYNFTIRSNKPIRPDAIHYLLWDDAAMEVYGAKSIVYNRRESVTEFPFSLQIPTADYNELKIFAYFETQHQGSSQIISTSKSINTHNYLKIRVSRRTEIIAPAPVSTSAPAPALPPAPGTNGRSISGPSGGTAVQVETPGGLTPNPEVEYEYEDQGDDPGVTKQEESESQAKTSDRLEVKPGDAVEIQFETYPNSTIAIRGIDQSLLLLTEQDNDLNQETVESKRASSQPPQQPELNIIPPDNSTFLNAFRALGISVLNSERFEGFGELAVTHANSDPLEEGEVGADGNDLTDASSIPRVDTRLRTEFPETWLWQELDSSSNSSTTVLSTTLPDTLTSWIISGFSLNPKTGLGVASPATITGFMPFFVTLNLPYSVVKFETFDLQVIVHNYLDRDVTVSVTLFNRHNDFDFVDNKDNRNGNKTQSIKVQRNQAALTHFVITPMEMGEIPIEIKAATQDGTATDAMRRHLKVKPDGVRETRNRVLVFDPEIGGKSRIRTENLDVEFPQNVVQGASSLKLTVVGNPMGPLLSSLGSGSSGSAGLLRVPYGCGYQNMGPFASNTLAMLYLSATNYNTPNANSVKQAAIGHLQTGYQRQMTYRKSNGGFGVRENTEALSWITSLVLRWFVVAQRYIYIDPNVIETAANFVRSSQGSDGSFSSSIQYTQYSGINFGSGVDSSQSSDVSFSSKVALTAKTTLDFIQARSVRNTGNLNSAIQKGMNFISSDSVYGLDNNYVTNFVTATLVAGNHTGKDRFFEKMEQNAKNATNPQGVKVKYWDMKNKTEVASNSEAVEMTSYALLAHLWKRTTLDVSTVKINNWLLSRRNPNGGFFSTLDTTIGLMALTEFALKPKVNFGDELQLNIRASNSSSSSSSSSSVNANKNDTELSVSVVPRNHMVLQEFDLPVDIKKLSVTANGSGPALVQLTETWYVPLIKTPKRRPQDQFTTATTKDHFRITAKMTIPDPEEEPTETLLKVCVNSLNTKGAPDSITSIQLPTGYAFYGEDYEADSEFMKSKPKNAQRFELSEGNTKMEVYYGEIKGHPPTCLSLQATQKTEVADAKNSRIHAYEFDNPERDGQVVYEPAHKITVCQLCRRTGTCGANNCD